MNEPMDRSMLVASLQHTESRAWLVIIVSGLFFCYIFAQMTLFNAMGKALIASFQMSPTSFGHLSACYFYGNLLFLIPAGLMLDRMSPRNLLVIMTGIAALATYLFSISDQLIVAELSRLIIGVSGSFAFLTVLRLATRWFSGDRLAFVIGVVVTIAMIGGVVAQTPFVWMTEHFGWRVSLQYVSISGGVIMLLIALFVKDAPNNAAAIDATTEKISKVMTSFKLALLNRQNWLGGLIISLLNLPVFVFGATWGSIYLQQMHHMSGLEASHITTMVFVGMIVGSPLIGWVSDRYSLGFSQSKGLQLRQTGSRRQPLLISAWLSTFLIFILMASTSLSYPVLLGLFFIMGLFSSLQICGYPLVAESNPRHLTASAGAISSMLIMAGGFVLPLFGWLISYSGDVKMLHHEAIYSTVDFTLALSLLPISFMIAGVAAYFIKETIDQPASILDQ